MADFAIGQKVAIYSPTGNYVQEVTIERDTKLYWIAGGRKFRKTDGILAADDEQVIATQAENRKRSRFASIARAYDSLRADNENPDRIQALRAALDFYTEVLK